MKEEKEEEEGGGWDLGDWFLSSGLFWVLLLMEMVVIVPKGIGSGWSLWN